MASMRLTNAVLARSADDAELAPIRLTNAAAQLAYGSGQTQGEGKWV